VPGERAGDDDGRARHEEEGRLEHLGPRTTLHVAHEEGQVGHVHQREPDRQLPPRSTADEVVRVVVAVVGVAVVLDVDERERRNEISGETKSIATRPNATLTQRCVLIE
jgi:hypothetical protein